MDNGLGLDGGEEEEKEKGEMRRLDMTARDKVGESDERVGALVGGQHGTVSAGLKKGTSVKNEPGESGMRAGNKVAGTQGAADSDISRRFHSQCTRDTVNAFGGGGGCCRHNSPGRARAR